MQIAFKTDQGQRRKNNQDVVGSFLSNSGLPLVLVADGMGGHLAGDVASRTLVESLAEKWQAESIETPELAEAWLSLNIQKENEAIYELGQEKEDYFGMGTTIVAAVLFENEVALAHVGDSRAYLLRSGVLKQVTQDHSLVNELLKQGEITVEMAEKHPRKNVLTRSIGVPGPIDVDTARFTVDSGDQLFLCSDGLSNMLSYNEILRVLSNKASVEERVTTFIRLANEAGGLDNISVLLVNFNQADKEGRNDRDWKEIKRSLQNHT